MVNPSTWDRLLAIAREHTTYSIRSPRRVELSVHTRVAEDLGLQGELALDFLDAIEKEFPGFEFVGEQGDFDFGKYFLSQISQTFGASWLYLFNRNAKESDKAKKLPLTLGMLEDALSLGYWETARYAPAEDE